MVIASGWWCVAVAVAILALTNENSGRYEHAITENKQDGCRCQRQEAINRWHPQKCVPDSDHQEADAEEDPVLARERQFGACQVKPSFVDGSGQMPGPVLATLLADTRRTALASAQIEQAGATYTTAAGRLDLRDPR